MATIRVQIKEVYGVNRIYVVGVHKAPLAVLTGQKTLSEAQAEALKTLGFTFKVVPAHNTLDTKTLFAGLEN